MTSMAKGDRGVRQIITDTVRQLVGIQEPHDRCRGSHFYKITNVNTMCFYKRGTLE